MSVALAAVDCDIICLTEGYAEVLPGGGHVIDAGPDWGYAAKEGRRKVLLWSKQPWSRPWCDLDPARSNWIPGGRFVAGTTQTDLGPVVIMGVCIPWERAHVDTGRKDRERWEDHERWLEGFAKRRFGSNAKMTIVLGDFNQRIPRKRVRTRTHELLLGAFGGFTIPTAGDLAQAPAPAIDHIAHSPDFALVGDIGIWPKRSENGEHLSDHFGVWGSFRRDRDGENMRRSATERMSEPLSLAPYTPRLAAAWKKFYENGDDTGLIALEIFSRGEAERAY